jgi:hypothetical protein
MEEDTAPPRRNDALLLGGMRATRSTSMRFTEPQGRMEERPVPPRQSTRSSAQPPYTPCYSTYGFIILSQEEEAFMWPRCTYPFRTQGLGFSFKGRKIDWKRVSLSQQRKIKEEES